MRTVPIDGFTAEVAEALTGRVPSPRPATPAQGQMVDQVAGASGLSAERVAWVLGRVGPVLAERVAELVLGAWAVGHDVGRAPGSPQIGDATEYPSVSQPATQVPMTDDMAMMLLRLGALVEAEQQGERDVMRIPARVADLRDMLDVPLAERDYLLLATVAGPVDGVADVAGRIWESGHDTGLRLARDLAEKHAAALAAELADLTGGVA